MAKYQKKPDVSIAYIPGLGRISDDHVIEGEFDQYVPSLLVKLGDSDAAVPKVVAIEEPKAAVIEAEEPMVDPEAEALDAAALAEAVEAEAEADEADEAPSDTDIGSSSSSSKKHSQRKKKK